MTRLGQSHPAPDDGTVGRDAEVAATESPVGALLERRLCEIVEAVGGREVGTNGRELWFRPASLPETEIRLGSEFDAPSYDRSANLAISYSAGDLKGLYPCSPRRRRHDQVDRRHAPARGSGEIQRRCASGRETIFRCHRVPDQRRGARQRWPVT